MQVKSAKIYIKNPPEYEESHYKPNERCIHMRANLEEDVDQYTDVFRHEFGHFVDHKLDFVSSSAEFKNAIQQDKKMRQPGEENWTETVQSMMEDLMVNNAVDSTYISDIFSGLYMNDTRITEYYCDITGLAFYGHELEYWTGADSKAPPDPVEKEVFANLFGIYSENQSAAIEYVEKWFPNTTECFRKILENNGF